ncbi:uncharacterized protein Z518_05979 [Rhinocladiella mackenziei CBS 650.93]|uniref:Fungal N-terminal domain-containing protein n=1 Tax=Rhinocladiella mackenziei CBS 650.93 TaxID=1442369 RepID=A0A0D2FSK2_9EURO|nr:uncharacterized protein Z518_05979 [Rhinocladiella mackenziei CBS 650.93]KIX05107.1 hypothetical protein Z518_05979 [Rhinocladiella mackenziei CBS 650.93]
MSHVVVLQVMSMADPISIIGAVIATIGAIERTSKFIDGMVGAPESIKDALNSKGVFSFCKKTTMNASSGRHVTKIDQRMKEMQIKLGIDNVSRADSDYAGSEDTDYRCTVRTKEWVMADETIVEEDDDSVITDDLDHDPNVVVDSMEQRHHLQEVTRAQRVCHSASVSPGISAERVDASSMWSAQRHESESDWSEDPMPPDLRRLSMSGIMIQMDNFRGPHQDTVSSQYSDSPDNVMEATDMRPRGFGTSADSPRDDGPLSFGMTVTGRLGIGSDLSQRETAQVNAPVLAGPTFPAFPLVRARG